MNKESQKHWDTVYTKRDSKTLGWYEENPTACIKLTEKCNLNKNDFILEIGAGATTFIDYLVTKGFENIAAIDISDAALKVAQERLGIKKSSAINWIIDDLTEPENINLLSDVALWHDRAVLHFLTEEEDRKAYFNLIQKTVQKDGFVIIAVFSLEGAKKCSGLDVYNYDAVMIDNYIGDNFKLIDSFDYLYIMPNGSERPYVYTLFQRMS